MKKEKENSEYNSIFNPKESWRKEVFFLSLSSLLLSLVICGAIQQYEDHETLDE